MTLEERIEVLEAENKEMKLTIEQLGLNISTANCSVESLRANFFDINSQVQEFKMTVIAHS